MRIRNVLSVLGLAAFSFVGVARADLDTLGVYGNAADGDGSSFVDNGGGAFDILAGGSDFWSNTDHGAFLYDGAATTSGSFTAVVRSVGFSGPDGLAGEWGRTGPMARADGAVANSANVFTARKSGGGVGIAFQGRSGNGTDTERNGPNGDFPDSGPFSANGTTDPVWLALSRTDDGLFLGHWAPDDGGAPGAWSVAAVRPVMPDLAGDLHVGLAHQSHSLPRRNTAHFDNWSLGAFDGSLPGTDVTLDDFKVLPAGRLPGPGPTGMNFGVMEIRDASVGNIQRAVELALNDEGTRTTGTHPILDITDPDTNGNGGPILGSDPIPYLTNTPGDDNNIVSVVHGQLMVPEAGQYTIQVRADDGFAMRFNTGAISWDEAHGGGGIDPLDPGTLVFPTGTGDTNTRGVITLPEGTVDFEFINWEGGGGAYYEVTSAKGVHPGAGSAQWLPLGDGSHLDAIPAAPRDVRLIAPANLVNGGDANNIPDTIAAIEAAILDPASPKNTQDTLTIGSGDMPNGGGDEYSTGVFGSFLVDNNNGVPDETIQLTFTLRSDDGSALHIFGESFTAVGGDGQTALTEKDGDQMLTADFFTGNTNAFGLIELTEGTYGFEAFHFEGGGGDNLNIFFATGDHLGNFSEANFYPLSTSGEAGAGIPANWGLKAVPEPSSMALAGIGLLSLLGVVRRRRK